MTEGQLIKFELVPYTAGVGVDLSPGVQTKLFRHWISKAETRIEWERIPQFADQSLDFVFSRNVVDRVTEDERRGAFKDWWRALKYGGCLSLLFSPGEIVAPDKVQATLAGIGFWDLAVDKTYESGAVLRIYRKSRERRFTYSHRDPVPENAVVVVRYGGIGDCFIASSILPGLKRQGHHVIMNTQATGAEMFAGNPWIDQFLVQDRNQLENDELPHWWLFLKERYGRLINLCETMEGSICLLEGRANFAWPQSVRQKYFGSLNYYDLAHDMAEVPLPPEPGFFPTDIEKKQAAKRRRDIGPDKFVLLWVLSGSAAHKRLYQVDFTLGIPGIPGLLDQYPELHVILVGDDYCKLFEGGWETHPRVTCASGEWNLRETLAMLDQVDCVVGPETGILNAAGMRECATIVALSHTNEHTLCRYWKNYTALAPEGCDCFPCYRLHYTDGPFCTMDEGPVPEDPSETNVRMSRCVRGISVERIQEAVAHYIEQARQERAA